MEHPITPPPELVQRLCDAAFLRGADGASRGEVDVWLILEAFAAGADQEFEACCSEVSWFTADLLRGARRPKPPSLREQALNTLDGMSGCMRAGFIPKRSDLDTIRRALEQLND
jgi:hypothetical protein